MQDPDHDSAASAPSARPIITRLLLQRLAVVILVIGLFSSALILIACIDVTEDDAPNLAIASFSTSKKYAQDVERMGGKSLIVIAEMREWFSGLWHGRRLAGTIAVISFSMGALLLFVADQLPPHEED